MGGLRLSPALGRRLVGGGWHDVDSETGSGLCSVLSGGVNFYARHSQRYFDAATGCIQLVIGGNADLDGISDQGKTDIALALEEDRPFTFDDSVTTPRENSFRRLEASLKSVIPDYKREDAEDFIRRLKPVLRANPLIAEHAKTRDELYELTTQLRARVLDRMRPFHET